MFTLQSGAQHAAALSSQSGQTGKGDSAPCVAAAAAVRRLTPTECSRLQGFPDDWNKHGRKPDGRTYEQKDGPRYKQLGNAVAVPVVEWIARRLAVVDEVK
jgi:DNA (cytosine-5)-methyltransferase 1